jgi:hypothetical protein
MQVACGNCQLTFDAPEGTTGLVCPICRNPLQVDSGGGNGTKPAPKLLEWNGGSLTDLIALLSGPAVSARVEVIPLGAESPIGEVHLVAGGVSDSIYDGQATDDALDKLLTITPARFRVDPRLPHPQTGDLGNPGPDSGTLDGRPLAHLMRYCEDYVITCAIEVWRGNETARVDYKRGEISGVTVGGIDAPERLAEVMQWASGNYRLNVPPISLPTVAPRRPSAAAMPVVAEPAVRQASATKTIFGIPQSEIAAARAKAEAIMQAQGVGTPAPPEVAPPPAAAAAPVSATPVAATPAPAHTTPTPILTPPGVAPSAVPAPVAASRASATKTMFGIPAPELPEGFISPNAPAPSAAAPVEAAAPVAQVAESETGRTDRVTKTGARKVAVPGPEIVQAAATAQAAPTPAAAPAKEVGRTTHFGYEAAPKKAPEKEDKSDKVDKTRPTRAPAPAPAPAAAAPAARQAPIWTYVGVGFTFGLVLLGIYQLVGRLAH